MLFNEQIWIGLGLSFNQGNPHDGIVIIAKLPWINPLNVFGELGFDAIHAVTQFCISQIHIRTLRKLNKDPTAAAVAV